MCGLVVFCFIQWIMIHYYHYLSWCSDHPRSGLWEPTKASLCVFLTRPHHSLSTSSLSSTSICSGLILKFLVPSSGISCSSPELWLFLVENEWWQDSLWSNFNQAPLVRVRWSSSPSVLGHMHGLGWLRFNDPISFRPGQEIFHSFPPAIHAFWKPAQCQQLPSLCGSKQPVLRALPKGPGFQHLSQKWAEGAPGDSGASCGPQYGFPSQDIIHLPREEIYKVPGDRKIPESPAQVIRDW